MVVGAAVMVVTVLARWGRRCPRAAGPGGAAQQRERYLDYLEGMREDFAKSERTAR